MLPRPPRSTLFPYDALPIFLEDHRVHGGTGLHERGGEDRERAAVLDVARSTEEPLRRVERRRVDTTGEDATDRKSTRLNSSHSSSSYAVFCLKKKKNESISR